MIKHISIGEMNISLVFRHRFEKPKDDEVFVSRYSWPRYELGFWYRHAKMVAKKNFKNPSKWQHVSSHSFGVELLICRFFINYDFGGMHLSTD